jgi:hypothetical protein
MMRKRGAQFAYSMAPIGIVVTACSGAPPAPSLTWKVDCVSVLGIPTPSGQTPRAAVPPPAGVRRDVRIGDLTDAELAQLADWEACVTGAGYSHECCSDTVCPLGTAGPPPAGVSFRLFTTPVLADAVATCYTVFDSRGPVGSREDAISLLKTSLLANCHVGPYEDCTVEGITGFRGGAAPDCAELNALCDLPSD